MSKIIIIFENIYIFLMLYSLFIYNCVILYLDQQKRSFSKSPDINNLQAGYATNFGAGQGPNANRALENFIVESTFRVLVTRFALMHNELKLLDNSVSTTIKHNYIFTV